MSADPTAFDLIDEARFARRMLAITDASLAKIEAAAVSSPGPTRLEVPTVSAAGWSDAVLYVIRTERAKLTPAREIAAMLERMFAVEVSAALVMLAVLHFDLDRREVVERPIAVEVQVATEPPALEPPCGGMTGAEWEAQQASSRPGDEPAPTIVEPADWRDEARKLYDGGAGLIPFEIAKRLGVSAHDVCVAVVPGFSEKFEKRRAKQESAPEQPVDPAADWKAEAARLYDGAAGMSPFAISKQLGVSDFRVRSAVIPGYGTKDGRAYLRQRAAEQRKATPEAAKEVDPVANKVAVAAAISEEWEDEARRLYDGGKGLSVSAICRRLGVSLYKVSCAVKPGFRQHVAEGVSRRRGSGYFESAPKPKPAPAAPPKPAPKAAQPPARPAVQRKPISKAPPAPLPWSPPPRVVTDAPADIPAEGNGVHITALEHHHCRFPVGRGADGHETYCGCQKSAHGGSYCDEHAKRAFNAWPPRTPLPKLPTRLARQMSALPADDASTARRRA